MSTVFLFVLGVYLIHAVVMHRHEGPETEEETQLHRGMPAPLMPLTLFLVWQGLATPWIAAWLTAPGFLIGVGLLVLMMLLNQLRRRRGDVDGAEVSSPFFYVAGGALQSVLLVLALYIAFQAGALGRGLFDPKWVILGLIAGHLVFGISLGFSHRSFDSIRDIVAYVFDVRPLGRYLAQSPRQVFACLDISLIEELIYRVAAQGVILALTGSPWVAIGITAVVFSMVHRHFFYNHIVDSIEFLAFSLLLGALYYWTGSLMLVVLIHTVRNIEIVFFDHSGTPDEAMHHRFDYHRGLVPHVR